MKFIFVVLLFSFSCFSFAQTNVKDSIVVYKLSPQAKLRIYRPYKFMGSAVKYTIEVKNVDEIQKVTYKIKNKSAIEIPVEGAQKLELTVFENKKHDFEYLTVFPGDIVYFRFDYRKFLPVLIPVDDKEGEIQWLKWKVK